MTRLFGSGDRFQALLVGTTGLTFALVLIGVWTAIGGYGLTCEARWPFCDGAVFGLFPANWGSFVEWFHRLVAMITGFAIIGTAIGAWLSGESLRVRLATTLAVIATPIQVWLGALTVTRYELLVLAGHFGAALVILSLLIGATVWAIGPSTPAPVRLATAAAVMLPLVLVLSPGVLISHSTGLHVAYYATGLAAFVALLAGTLRGLDRGDSAPLVGSLGAATVIVAAALVVGRVDVELIVGTALAEILALGTVVAGMVLATLAVWIARNSATAPSPKSSTRAN